MDMLKVNQTGLENLEKEELEKILANVELLLYDKSTLSFLSQKQGEGKTSVILALSEYLSVQKKKVLYVCVSKNSKNDWMSFPKQDEILPSTIKNMDGLLWNGKEKAYETIKEELEKLKKSYDYILLELEAADTSSIWMKYAQLSDLVVVVMQSNLNKVSAVNDTIKQLRKLKCDNVYAILNRTSKSRKIFPRKNR